MLSSAISCVEQRERRGKEMGGGEWEWRTERRGKEDKRKLHRKRGADKEAGGKSERCLGWDGSQKAAVVCRGCDTEEFRCTPHCSGEQSCEVALLQCGV